MSKVYFKGFNTLRFFAAFLVLLSHAYLSVRKLSPLSVFDFPVFEKGAEAVEFFFTLSGFLITYLLLEELRSRNGINIQKFYLRRVLRIWPLYFIIVSFGFVLFGLIFPIVYHEPYFNFPSVTSGFLLYALFVPNFASAFYKVGLLYPLWSIGVEEQFYLFWAPLLKFFEKKLLFVMVSVTIVSSMVSWLGDVGFHQMTDAQSTFINSFKFHCMGVGGVFAYLVHGKRINRRIIDNQIFQYAVVGFALAVVFLDLSTGFGTIDELLKSVIFSLLLVVVSGDRAKINIETRWLSYLGKISYGIYMYHMLLDYCLRMGVPKIFVNYPKYFFPIYVMALLFLTVIVAGLSYRFIESPIIQIKMRVSFKVAST